MPSSTHFSLLQACCSDRTFKNEVSELTMRLMIRLLDVPLRVVAAVGFLHVHALAQQELASGETVTIELNSVESSLEFVYEVESRSVVYLYAESKALDPILLVENDMLEVVGEDDASGHGTSAFLEMEQAAGSVLWITLGTAHALEDGFEGEVDLRITEVPRLTEDRLPGLQEASRRIDRSDDLWTRGQYRPSREAAKKAVDQLLEISEPPTVEVIAKLWTGGHAAFRALDSQTAYGAWECVRKTRSQTLPADHPDLQSARANLALAMRSLGDLDGAREIQEQVLNAQLGALPVGHPDLQMARENLAATRFQLGDLEGARLLQEQVLEIRSRTLPEDHPQLQMTRGNLASTLRALGDLHGARMLDERVLEVFSRILPEDHPHLQVARASFAVTIKRLGDLEGARELEEQVLEIRSRTLPADHPHLQSARGNLAVTLFLLGDVEGARELEEQVLEFRSRRLSADHPALQRVRGNLALTIKALGDLDSAMELQEQVLEVLSRTLPADHPDLQMARGNLAGTHYHLGNLKLAKQLQEQVLEVYSRTLPFDHPDLQFARSSLASTIKALGDLEGARQIHEQVLRVLSRTRPLDHPDVQLARGNLALTITALGDLEGARKLQEQVLRVYSETLPTDHSNLQGARGNLAWTLARSPQRQGLRALLDDLASGTNIRLRSFASSLSPRALRALADQSRHSMSSFFSLSSVDGGGACESLVEAGFSLVETLRSIEPAQMRLHQALESINDAEFHRLHLIAIRMNREVVLHTQGQGSETVDPGRQIANGYLDGFAERRRAKEAADSQVAKRASELLGREGLLSSAASKDLAAVLEKDMALVGFWRYALTRIDQDSGELLPSVPSYLAHVLLPSGQLARVELGPAAIVDEAVQEWRSAIRELGQPRVERGAGSLAEERGGDRRDLQLEAGQRIRQLVFDPLMPLLGKTTRLIVAVDGTLHLVSLAVLPEGEGTLGDRFEFSYRTTLRELTVPDADLASSPSLLALGGVQYDRGRRVEMTGSEGSRSVGLPANLRDSATWREFPPLPYSAREIDIVAKSFAEKFPRVEDAPNIYLLEGQEASRGALQQLAPQVRYLHLATHGYFLDDSIPSMADERVIDHALGLSIDRSLGDQVRGYLPMTLCGLALAGANGPANEFGRVPGILTAQDLAQWDLGNCELAVLSACNTNVGVQRAGQGIASLQEALYAAGVRSSITSLWEVPDRPTQELFAEFYRRLWLLGEGKAEALWNAQQKLRYAKDAEGSSVYTTRDWAAWVLVGEPD